jgi:hypothetical protein
LAALLHDVGHAPFSHSGEDLLPRSADGKKVTHEDMTAKIIRETEIGEKIETWFSSDGIDREDVIAVSTAFSKARNKKPSAHVSILNEMLTGDLGAIVSIICYEMHITLASGQAPSITID